MQELIWIISCCNFGSECSRQLSFSYFLYWPWCSLLETPTFYTQEKSFKTLRNDVLMMCLIWDILSGYAYRDFTVFVMYLCRLNFSVLLWLVINVSVSKHKWKTDSYYLHRCIACLVNTSLRSHEFSSMWTTIHGPVFYFVILWPHFYFCETLKNNWFPTWNCINQVGEFWLVAY